MKKKSIIFIVILLFIILFLVGFMLIFMNRNRIHLKTNEFIFEFGEEVCSKVECYIEDASSTKDINEFKLISNDIEIKNDKFVSKNSEVLSIGKYNLEIKYKNQTKKFSIEVVDSTPPEFIEFSELIVIEQNSIDVDLTSFFKAEDLTEVRINVQGDVDLTTLGEYVIDVIATDENNNKFEKEVTVEVIDFETAKDENRVSTNIDGIRYKSSAMVEYENIKNKPQETISNSSNISSSNNSNSSSSNQSTTSSSNNSNKPSNNGNTVSARYRKDISDSYVSKINAYRVSIGLSSLPVTSEAQAEADRRAKEIVTNQSHDGSSYGFGENIGGGGIGTDFYNLWMNSHAHYNAIIREQNVAIASSVYEVDGMWYAVVVFRMNY